uniref:Peptidase S54 rhomboid domain-containing protein n=1 Tax=Chaetoceros debilis TaxID=122233 RepID=A0A7S3PV97_9STRA
MRLFFKLSQLLLISWTAAATKTRNNAKKSRSNTIVNELPLSIQRGGNYERNPNYYDPNPNQFMSPTLGEMEDSQIYRPQQQQQYQQQNSYTKKPKPIAQFIQEYFIALQKASPTLYYGTLSSLIIFMTWQIPIRPLSNLLRNHFINSQYNLRKRRYHTLFTSALSHTTLTHLAMNIYGFNTFGKSILPVLSTNGMPFSLYCILGGIFSNLFFASVHPAGSCIGLSGVTLSLLAMDAKLNPGKEIGFLFRFIPIKLPAQYALIALLVWSIFGTMNTMGGGGDGIAHATHLGGLLYGMLMHELMRNGLWNSFFRKKWLIVNRRWLQSSKKRSRPKFLK